MFVRLAPDCEPAVGTPSRSGEIGGVALLARATSWIAATFPNDVGPAHARGELVQYGFQVILSL